MDPLYGPRGDVVAWLKDDRFIGLTSGATLGWLRDDAVYSLRGTLVGWLRSCWV